MGNIKILLYELNWILTHMCFHSTSKVDSSEPWPVAYVACNIKKSKHWKNKQISLQQYTKPICLLTSLPKLWYLQCSIIRKLLVEYNSLEMSQSHIEIKTHQHGQTAHKSNLNTCKQNLRSLFALWPRNVSKGDWFSLRNPQSHT